MALKLRRGNTTTRLAITPDEGELIYDTQQKRLYAGDGTTAGGVLVSYAGSVGGDMGSDLNLSGNDLVGQGNINIEGTITSTGNIFSGGTITATGNIVANGNITLGNENTDNLVIGADVNSNIVPNTDIAFNIGASNKRWNTVFANNVFADLEGNVRAQDSTVLVDSYAGVLRGQLEGNLVGPVQGNVQGNVTGDLTGPVRSANGTIVVDNGEDGTDAVFTGRFVGVLEGSVDGGVLTTESYADPNWIISLNANKIFGTLNNVVLNGDVTGSVFSDDSTILVDGVEGVLRGTLIGTLNGDVNTTELNIIGNNIFGDTGRNIFISTQGIGTYVNFASEIRSTSINIQNEPATNGLTVSHSANTSRPFTTFGAYDGTSSSSGTGAAASFSRARGTTSLPTTLQSGDEIATVVFAGATATPAIPSSFKEAANIMAKAVTVSSGSYIEGRLEFRTTNSSGVSATKVAINGDGSLEMTDSLLIAGGSAGQVNTSAPVKFVKVFLGATAYAMPLYAIN